jgi:hypothetical protein
MTGGARLRDLQEQCVAVAVDIGFDKLLRVAGGFAFSPESPSRAGPIGDIPGRKRLAQGLRIHPGEHQNLAGFGILRYRWYKTIGVESNGGKESTG